MNNVFVCLPTGYGKSKLCRLLWNTNLVEIARAVIIVSAPVAILSSSSSVSKDNIGTEECVCRGTSVHQKLLQLLNGEMSWKENSSLLGFCHISWMKHTVSQNGEFIARYC